MKRRPYDMVENKERKKERKKQVLGEVMAQADGSKWRIQRSTYHETSPNRSFLTRLWPRSEHPGPFDDEKKRAAKQGTRKKREKKKKKKKKSQWSRRRGTLIRPDYSGEDANLARLRGGRKNEKWFGRSAWAQNQVWERRVLLRTGGRWCTRRIGKDHSLGWNRGERGAHDGALVKKEELTKSEKRGLASHAIAGYGYVYSFSFTLFVLHIHVIYASLYQVRQNTQHHPEGSTMAAPVPHLTKAKGKHDERKTK